MATSFIRKNWQKDATDTLLNAGVRFAGGATGGFIATKLSKSTGNAAKTLNNIGGPTMVVLGVLGDMMVEQPQVRAFCQGLATYGAMHSLAVIAPDTIGKNIGVNGLGDMEEDAALMSAVDANYSGDISSEIKSLQNGANANDGNDWAQVAEQVDYDGAVQGADDEENAELMGDDEENAELMGDDEIAELMGDDEEENAELMGDDEEYTDDPEAIAGMF